MEVFVITFINKSEEFPYEFVNTAIVIAENREQAIELATAGFAKEDISRISATKRSLKRAKIIYHYRDDID